MAASGEDLALRKLDEPDVLRIGDGDPLAVGRHHRHARVLGPVRRWNG